MIDDDINATLLKRIEHGLVIGGHVERAEAFVVEVVIVVRRPSDVQVLQAIQLNQARPLKGLHPEMDFRRKYDIR